MKIYKRIFNQQQFMSLFEKLIYGFMNRPPSKEERIIMCSNHQKPPSFIPSCIGSKNREALGNKQKKGRKKFR
jgi:hypothetical protein